MFEPADIAHRVRLGEDSRWEFKQIEFRGDRPIKPRRDDLADELAGFANANGGVMPCGVTDDGKVQGMSRAPLDQLERVILEACTGAVKPSLDFATCRLEIDGKALLAVEVERGHALHDSPGGSFRRMGSSKRQLTSDDRLRFAKRRAQARFLWFDKQPVPNAAITATFYAGADRASGQLDAQEIVGPLPRQVADAMAFALRNMRVGAYKDPADPARTNLPQYSEAALFEALVNAIAHRDYSIRGSRIRLSMFADRVEVNSPGGLPNNLTIDGMAARQATRNEALASLLGRMPVGDIPGANDRRFFMERRGDGVPIVMRETESLCGRPPSYVLHDESDLFLTIPAAATVATPATVTATVRDRDQPVVGAQLLALFPEATGHVPALRGRLNPIRDQHDRIYLYASNIAINQGEPQPVHFRYGEEMHLMDAGGSEMAVRVIDIVGRSALVEYRVPSPPSRPDA